MRQVAGKDGRGGQAKSATRRAKSEGSKHKASSVAQKAQSPARPLYPSTSSTGNPSSAQAFNPPWTEYACTPSWRKTLVATRLVSPS